MLNNSSSTASSITATIASTATASDFVLVCGMEVHAELKTASKMFCGCKNDPFGAQEPNSHTCPVCLGMPGGIPVANKKAIEWTIRLGLALGCEINLFSKFDRKHYFYPDLAKGYQISQYDLPFCFNGVIQTSEGPVRIRRIHLEEDTGKLIHKTINRGQGDEKVSLVDFNRSGVPLIEIVTEADIKSPSQAKEYSKNLRTILRYLEIADCDMEQGGMRLEANVSLRRTTDPDPVGVDQTTENLPDYKVELKNINSFRFLEQAIEFEMDRQAEELKAGQTPIQETRGWDSVKNRTFSQRTKEDAEDYRYFPDPDIPPIRFSQEQIDAIRAEVPQLPAAVASRWFADFGVEERYGSQLAASQAEVAVLEEAFAQLAGGDKKDSAVPTPNTLAGDLVNKKMQVTALSATAADLVKACRSLHQVAEIDEAKLKTVIAQIQAKFPDETSRYKAGETKLLNFFIGQVMREMKQKVDVEKIREWL